jgi:hypothetical protein
MEGKPMRTINVVTGSDAFILTSAMSEKIIEGLASFNEQEFRLTLTIHWEEFRQPTQAAGTLWFEYLLGKSTPALPGVEAVVPIVTPGPECTTFLIVIGAGHCPAMNGATLIPPADCAPTVRIMGKLLTVVLSWH